MIRPIALLIVLLCILHPAHAEDAVKVAEFSKSVAATKDVAALATMLGQQIQSVPELLLQIKDAGSLATVKSSFKELSDRVTVISKRLAQLPVPSGPEREVIARKMEEADAANGKKQQPAIQAHIKAMPADLKTAAMQEMQTFYQGLDVQGKVFKKYFQPDEKPSTEEPKKPSSAKTENP